MFTRLIRFGPVFILKISLLISQYPIKLLSLLFYFISFTFEFKLLLTLLKFSILYRVVILINYACKCTHIRVRIGLGVVSKAVLKTTRFSFRFWKQAISDLSLMLGWFDPKKFLRFLGAYLIHQRCLCQLRLFKFTWKVT